MSGLGPMQILIYMLCRFPCHSRPRGTQSRPLRADGFGVCMRLRCVRQRASEAFLAVELLRKQSKTTPTDLIP